MKIEYSNGFGGRYKRERYFIYVTLYILYVHFFPHKDVSHLYHAAFVVCFIRLKYLLIIILQTMEETKKVNLYYARDFCILYLLTNTLLASIIIFTVQMRKRK